MNNTKLRIKVFPALYEVLLQKDLDTAYLFFGVWKKVHSTIFDYKSELAVAKMSAIMGCSTSTTRRMIKQLFALGWVTEEFENANHLRFVSNKTLLAQFGLSEKQNAFNIPYVGKQTRDIMSLSVLILNLARQDFKITEKLNRNVGKFLTKIYAANKSACADAVQNERGMKQFFLNFDITITRAGIAKAINRLSISSGRNLLNRLSKMGLVESDVNRIAKLSDKANGHYKNTYDKSAYVNSKGELWMQLPNKVKFNDIRSIDSLLRELSSGLKKQANVCFKYNASYQENMLELFANVDQRKSVYLYYAEKDFNLSKTKKGLEIIKKDNPLYDVYLNKSMLNYN
jgi:Mn-dependent DtxR family transcriptional regulator